MDKEIIMVNIARAWGMNSKFFFWFLTVKQEN